MKILLINPSVNLESYGRFKNLLDPMPCIGLAYIAAMLERSAHEVHVLDNFVFRLNPGAILDRVEKINPEMIGFSCLTPSFGNTLRLMRKIKDRFPHIIIALGNVHAEFNARQIVEKGQADFVIHGEGEYTFTELANALENGKKYSGIQGLTFCDNGKVVQTSPRPPIRELDSLPYPAWHLFPFERYGFFMGLGGEKNKPILSILASRGCPFRCDFCSAVYSSWKHYRKRAPEKIVQEIIFLIDRFNVRMLGFMDSEFPLEKKHAHKVLDCMIRERIGEKITWLTEARVDGVDDEILLKMKKAGCTKILFGLESGNQDSLDLLNKRITIEQSRRAVQSSRKAGLHTVGLFMIGLPGETPENILNTFRFACELNLDYAKFSILTPMPGSRMFERFQREGKLRHENWDEYTTFNPRPENFVYCPEALSPEKLIRLQKKGLRMFYFRPRQIWNHLFRIRSLSIRDILYGLWDVLF
jgi:radical SAM superfamily enzyme YgiQ (UPF0313 family)